MSSSPSLSRSHAGGDTPVEIAIGGHEPGIGCGVSHVFACIGSVVFLCCTTNPVLPAQSDDVLAAVETLDRSVQEFYDLAAHTIQESVRVAELHSAKARMHGDLHRFAAAGVIQRGVAEAKQREEEAAVDAIQQGVAVLARRAVLHGDVLDFGAADLIQRSLAEAGEVQRQVAYREGDRVEAHWRGRGRWYKGVIVRTYGASCGVEMHYDITYDDGNTEGGVRAHNIRPEVAPEAAAAAGDDAEDEELKQRRSRHEELNGTIDALRDEIDAASAAAQENREVDKRLAHLRNGHGHGTPKRQGAPRPRAVEPPRGPGYDASSSVRAHSGGPRCALALSTCRRGDLAAVRSLRAQTSSVHPRCTCSWLFGVCPWASTSAEMCPTSSLLRAPTISSHRT